MILVTVGSSERPFNRLLAAVDAVAPRLGEPVVMQSGLVPFPGRHTQCVGLLAFSEMEVLCRKARVMVGHASIGVVIVARRFGQPLVLVPRDPARGEVFNDHQLQFARAVQNTSPMIEVLDDVVGLEDAIRRAQEKADGHAAYGPDLEHERLLAAIRAAVEGRNSITP